MLSSVIFILGCLIYAIYSYCQIALGTATWEWHVVQWMSVVLFLLSGICFGRELNKMTWRRFGRMVAIAVLGIPVYVFGLHFMLDNLK